MHENTHVHVTGLIVYTTIKRLTGTFGGVALVYGVSKTLMPKVIVLDVYLPTQILVDIAIWEEGFQ